MKKPIIGISSNIMFEEKDRFFLGYKYSYISDKYVQAVSKNGGIPLVLPLIYTEEDIEEQVSNLDGLIISGGYDIDPLNFNEEPLEKLQDICPERDNYELKLIEFAYKKNIPILGICRGHQLLNVAFGGTLYQDLSYVQNNTLKHCQDAAYYNLTHSITIEKDSIFFEISNQKEKEYVNSFHHLAIKDLAKDFKIAATSKDKIIEAIEYKKDKFIIGVQFHPEMTFEVSSFAKNIFQKFINSCMASSRAK